ACLSPAAPHPPHGTILTGLTVGAPVAVYSLDNNVLTAEQRQFYEDDGYLLIKNLVSDENIERFRYGEFVRICNKEVNPLGVLIMRHEIHRPDFIHSQKIPINKLPDLGKQSSREWEMQKLLLSLGCCLSPCIRTCTISPSSLQWGTHKQPLKPHAYSKWESLLIKFFHGLLDYDEKSPRVHVIMKKRDTVFFHPLFIHGSRANRFLKSISCCFASSECCYIDVKNVIQGHLK
uniref:phytanoyl-CoA dioxygenase n=1 Tax=Athene cunicularia TaxID=194338 RepID=A0A663LZD5_ATHCN